jgi:hypothetical protein
MRLVWWPGLGMWSLEFGSYVVVTRISRMVTRSVVYRWLSGYVGSGYKDVVTRM